MTYIEWRVKNLEKKVAELERQLIDQLTKFTPEDSDGIRDSHGSISTVPPITTHE